MLSRAHSQDLSSAHSRPHVLIIHEVRDYPQWKGIFDQAATLRREAGERSYQVLRDELAPNLVVHFSIWTSHADARRFFESPQLEQIRRDAGVATPRFLYLQPVAAGEL